MRVPNSGWCHERAEKPRRRGRSDRRRRRSQRVSRGHYRRLSAGDGPDLRCSSAAHSLDFVSWKDRKPVADALKAIYRAVDADAGQTPLTGFEVAGYLNDRPANNAPKTYVELCKSLFAIGMSP